MKSNRKCIARTVSLSFYIITLFIIIIAVGCIKVEPNEVTIECGSTRQFTAKVIGLPNKDVSWSIDEGASFGTISSTGLYTAHDVLPSPPTATVRARSVANPKITDTAVLKLIGEPSDVGELGGPCYTDDTCNSGLICVDDICEEDSEDGIDDNIRNLSLLDQPDPLEEPNPIGEPEEVESNDPSYICTEQQYKAAPEFNEQICLDPGSDVIWIGAIVDGESIPTGEYTPITAKRGPLTFSVSLENLGGSPSITVDEASLSKVRNGVQEILSQNVTGSTPAYISFTNEQVYSEQQLKVAVGASYKSGFTNVSANFNFAREDIQTRILVKFIQKYYTVDIDIPEKPSDFFAPSVNWEDLEAQITGSTSPMYVSSISYGRMALFSFESSQSSTEVEANLETAFKGFGGEVSVEVQAARDYLSQNTTIRATIIGGSGADAVGTINGFQGLLTYIEEGGDYSKDSPGAPLAYKLRYLSNNSIGNIVMATEYTVRNCYPRTATEILEDFEEGAGGWTTGQKGKYKWIDCDVINPDGRCDCIGCEARGNFIQWYDEYEDGVYASYKAPPSFTDQLSGDYVGGYLEFWISHKSLNGNWALGSYTEIYPEVIITRGDNYQMYFHAEDSCEDGNVVNICEDEEPYWQKVSIYLGASGYGFPSCFHGLNWTRCATEEELRPYLDDVKELEIRAEYWDGAPSDETGFLDDVRIIPPENQ